MSHIICIANQKGGVGKTTTTVNLGASLAVAEQRSLLVDCDPQGNATTGTGINKADLSKSLYHGLIQSESVESLILDTELDHLKILPANMDLIGAEVELISHPNREGLLQELLKPLFDEYDYILFDCPPSLNLLTVNALTAAHTLLIPLQCEFYALEGLSQLLQTFSRIKKNLNRGLRIEGVLLTMFDKRNNLSHQVAEEANKYFKNLVFQTRIPRNVRLGEAPSFGKPILLYDITSPGAQSYLALAKEIINGRRRKQYA
ncbi:MAG: ParA family protein [Deltaproteobacteria bacterium]|nr:ParA family protein [Deltaproteobacteria bacterium]